MWLRVAFGFAALAGCGAPSFDMPHSGSAQGECNRYVDALMDRGAACGGGDPAATQLVETGLRDRCAHVLGMDPLGESVDHCVMAVDAMSCEAIHGSATLPWCPAFLEPPR
jgi:hypothetical protein